MSLLYCSQPNAVEFEKQKVTIFAELHRNGFDDFADYLIDNYFCEGRIKHWRPQDRQGFVASVNMALERNNRTLKEKFFKKSENKRLDECVDLIIKATDYFNHKHDVIVSVSLIN
jgi:hypothetical protein